MNKLITISLVLFSTIIFGQVDTSDIKMMPIHGKHHIQFYHPQFGGFNYRSRIENSSWELNREKYIHSNIPSNFRVLPFPEGKNKMQFISQKSSMSQYFSVLPLVDAMGGIEISQNTGAIYRAGVGVGIDYWKNKFTAALRFLPYYTQGGNINDSLQQNFGMDAGTNRGFFGNSIFYNAEFLMSYRPNKFFNFTGGYGRNFIGDGYRSMLQSDNIGSHPYLKIETQFAGIKYVNLYNFWRDNTTDPFDRSFDIPKFTSSHYISWNITKELNLSVFETVVFQTKDTLVNRGFDFNYINPIVFYRPVEYGLGSSDNVLLGMSMSYKPFNQHQIYMQFILDEFLLSEIQAKSKWWANKYGWQLGYKSTNFFAENLYFQIEMNGARPFTFSHKSSQHAYGHMNASATHPVGANFLELLNIVSYKKEKHRFTNKMNFITYGVDPADSISFGTNIFKPYTLRDGDYDHLMFQGIRTNVFNEEFIYEYALLPEIDMFVMAKYNWRMVNTSLGTNHFHAFSVGIRSRLWNSYSDF